MNADSIRLFVDEPLRMFLPARHRRDDVTVDLDGTSSLGHLVQSVGVPLTEVGGLLIGGIPVNPTHRPQAGERVVVRSPGRPQQWHGRRGFVLDVHLGSLTRRLRLLGLDACYRIDADDDELARLALTDNRVLLTMDRGLLRRRALQRHAAYVRGDRADDQLADILGRFEPPLAPYTRCPMCNGLLHQVAKADVAALIEPGTARSYERFTQCAQCGRVYWRGAHARRLAAVVETAQGVGNLNQCDARSSADGQ